MRSILSGEPMPFVGGWQMQRNQPHSGALFCDGYGDDGMRNNLACAVTSVAQNDQQ